MSTRKQLALAVAMLFCFAVPTTSQAGGNVVAFVEDGTLFIAGDKLPNHFFVREASGGGIEVNGVATGYGGTPPTTGWDDTLINGSSSVVFDETINELLIVSGDGNDQVHLLYGLHDIAVCEVSTGSGADQVRMSYGRIGSVNINTGKDEDLVDIATMIDGDLLIDTGHGEDRVSFQPIMISGVTDINTGGDNDVVRFRGFVGQPVTLVDLVVNLGQGDDILTFVWDVSAELVVVTGDALFVGGQGIDAVLYASALTVDGVVEFLGFEE